MISLFVLHNVLLHGQFSINSKRHICAYWAHDFEAQTEQVKYRPTCGVVYRALTPLVQQLSSQLRSFWLFSSSAWIWPLPSSPAQSSSP